MIFNVKIRSKSILEFQNSKFQNREWQSNFGKKKDFPVWRNDKELRAVLPEDSNSIPKSMVNSSQTPETPALGDLITFFPLKILHSLHTETQTCARAQTHTHTVGDQGWERDTWGNTATHMHLLQFIHESLDNTYISHWPIPLISQGSSFLIKRIVYKLFPYLSFLTKHSISSYIKQFCPLICIWVLKHSSYISFLVSINNSCD